jgi:hypothetical protein
VSEIIVTSIGVDAIIAIVEGRLETFAIGEPADLVLSRWAVRWLHAYRFCTPELAEAGRFTDWEVVPLDAQLRERRAAAACLFVAEGRMDEVRNFDDLVALVRGSAAWVSQPREPKQFVTAMVKTRIRGPFAHEIESAVVAWLDVPKTQHLFVFPTRTELDEYVRLLEAGQADDAFNMNKLVVHHRHAGVYASELREVFGTEYAPMVTLSRAGRRDSILPVAVAPQAAAVHAFGQLRDAETVTTALQLGIRTYETTFEVLSRTDIES